MKVETISAGKDTVFFAATAAANGEDTIINFTAGTSGDKLDVSAFLGTTSAAVGVGSGLGSGGLGVEIASSGFNSTASGAGNVIYVKDVASLTKDNFGSSAKANVIKVKENTDYVVIAKDTDNNTNTIYYVEVDANKAATVTSVGTMNIPAEAFVNANFG